jgi:chromosome segregation ATPase
MPTTLEERVAYLEGKVEEHSKGLEDIKDLIISLDQKLDRRIDALDQKLDRRIDALDQKIDGRVDALDQKIDGRVDALDQRINRLDQRIDRLDQRIDHLDQKITKYFLWIIGIQVTIFLSIIAILLK